jgi:hypothetical protein
VRSCLAFAFLFAAADLHPEESYAKPGILRGQLEAAVPSASGSLRVRTADGLVHLCYFDSHTYVERHGQPVRMAALEAGDPVEVLADRKGSYPCYARTVRVSEVKARSQRPGRTAMAARPVTERWMPRGDLTFAGVVLRLNPEMMVLRMRSGEHSLVLLRHDTRFVDSGLATTRESLAPNTRVFVRAWHNIDKELEAFQVVWGSLNGP